MYQVGGKNPFSTLKKKSCVKKRERYIHACWVVLKGSNFFSVFSLIKVIKELGKTKDTKATMIKRGENKQDGEKKSTGGYKKIYNITKNV